MASLLAPSLRPTMARSSSAPLRSLILPPTTCVSMRLPLAQVPEADRTNHRRRSFAYQALPSDYEPNELEEDTGPVTAELRRPFLQPLSRSSATDWLPSRSSAAGDGAPSLAPVRRSGLRRSRTQADRVTMSARERAIAHRLLEDFPSIRAKAGLEDFRLAPGSGLDDEPSAVDWHPSAQKDQHGKRRATSEDLERELLDEVVAEIDAIGTDVELVEWMNSRVFGLSASASSAPPTPRRFTSITQALAVEWESADGDVVPLSALRSDPSTPLHRTPLYPRILVHLLRRFRDTFHNPHLALHVFAAASTPSSGGTLPRSATLRATTPELYAEVFRTRWSHLGDVEGVRDGLRDLRRSGLPLSSAVRKAVAPIAPVVLVQDALRAEGQARRDLREAAAKEGLEGRDTEWEVTDKMVEQRRRFTASERAAAEEIEAMTAQAWEVEQEQAQLGAGSTWADVFAKQPQQEYQHQS